MARFNTGFRRGGERFEITFEFQNGETRTVSVAQAGATDLLSQRSFYKEQGVLDARVTDVFSVDGNRRFVDYENIDVGVKILFRKGFESGGFRARALEESDIPMEGSNADERLRGYSGNDLLRGKGGDDRLFGDKGLDRLNGGDGADVLNGGTGSDLLIGGRGADRFVFTRGFDEIRDFRDGRDVIDLRNLPDIDRFADIRSAARQEGDDLRLIFDDDRVLLIADFDREDLDRSDFIF